MFACACCFFCCCGVVDCDCVVDYWERWCCGCWYWRCVFVFVVLFLYLFWVVGYLLVDVCFKLVVYVMFIVVGLLNFGIWVLLISV